LQIRVDRFGGRVSLQVQITDVVLTGAIGGLTGPQLLPCGDGALEVALCSEALGVLHDGVPVVPPVRSHTRVNAINLTEGCQKKRDCLNERWRGGGVELRKGSLEAGKGPPSGEE